MKVHFGSNMYKTRNAYYQDRKIASSGSRMCAAFIAVIFYLVTMKEVYGISIVTCGLLLFLPFLYIKKGNRYVKVKANLCLLSMFLIYRIINHGTNLAEVLFAFVIYSYALFWIEGDIDFTALIKYMICIAYAATFVLIVQYIAHYIFGKHISFVFSPLLSDENAIMYSTVIATGVSDGIYRPSAFFLEPSQYAVYATPLLALLLFSDSWVGERKSRNSAIVITIGLVLTTSGMGIIGALFIWALYYFKCICSGNRKKIFRGIVAIMVGVLLIIILFTTVDAFQNAVMRVFKPVEGKSYNAFGGRTIGMIAMFKSMNIKEMIVGFKSGDISSVFQSSFARSIGMTSSTFFPGFATAIAGDGLIALMLYGSVLLYSVIKSNGVKRWICLYIFILGIVHDNYYFAYMMQLFPFVFADYGNSCRNYSIKGI